MAIAAFLAVVSIVIVIFQVAGNTDRLDLVSIGVVGVAVITLQQRVISKQVEVGIALMIKTRVRPVSGVVAGFTLFPVTTFVLVIRCVATKAVSRRARKCSVLVTIQANGLAVFAEQRKVSFVVIEFGFKPFGWLVAGATLCTHDFLMGLIFKMAVDALRRRFPMFQFR